MSARAIVLYPNPGLERVAPMVEVFDDKLKTLAADMIDTLQMTPGAVGLAAVQVDEPVRMFIALDDERKPVVFVNPDWVAASGHGVAHMREGCLSVPGVFESVDRYTGVVCVAKDLDGKTFTVEATGQFAQCIQHETEHLNGQIFVDRLSTTKRAKVMKTIERRARTKAFDELAQKMPGRR